MATIVGPGLDTAPAGQIAVSNGDGTWSPQNPDYVNVKMPPYGAVGDNTTDDSVAIQAAVTAALASGDVLWFPPGTYKTTVSIANFHVVRKEGPGVINSNTGLFYISPRYNERNNLYVVASGGNDSRDGLSGFTTSKLATLQGALDIIRNYGPTLRGTWQINLAAGTYPEGASYVLDDSSTVPPIVPGTRGQVRIIGTGGTSADPTTIIDGGTATRPHGIYIDGPFSVRVQGIKFQNWAAEATRMENGVDVEFRDAVCDTCGTGFYGNINARVLLRGRVVARNCNRGMKVKDQAVMSSVTGSSGTPLSELNAVGVDLLESTVAHLTALNVQDCTQRGMELGRNSRCVCDSGVGFARNATAVMAYASGIFEDNGVTWNDGTADRNITRFLIRDFSTEYMPTAAYNNQAYASRVKSVTADAVTRTGTTAEGALYTSSAAGIPFKIVPNNLNRLSRKLQMRVVGVLTGTAGTKTVRVKLGSTTLATKAFAAGDALTFEMVVELHHTGASDSGTQRIVQTVTRSGFAPDISTAASAISMNVASPMDVTVTGELANAADAIALHLVEATEV